MLRLPRLEPSGDRAVDFARTHAINEGTISPHKVEDRDVGTGLLCVTNDIERLQVGNSLCDLRGFVNVHRRAELAGQFYYWMSSDFGQRTGRKKGGGHLV